MAAIRIGGFAEDRAHVIVRLEWLTATAAQIRLCHWNQDTQGLPAERVTGSDEIKPARRDLGAFPLRGELLNFLERRGDRLEDFDGRSGQVLVETRP